MQLSIIIPCYNEFDNVPKLRDEFLPIAAQLIGFAPPEQESFQTVEIVFVDDGSSDGTHAALQEALADVERPGLKIKLVQHPRNRGLGAAIRTGFAAAGGDVVITSDSDGTYRHEEIPRLLAYLRPEVGIVTASPYHPAGGVANVPTYRLILSRGSSLLYRLFVKWQVHTYTALFRAYRQEVVKRVPFSSDGFLAGTEILVNGMFMGYQVAEYPTILHSRVHGVSKAKIARTIKAHLAYQARVILMRLGLVRVKASAPQSERPGDKELAL